jgi:hypothetical protein
MHGMRARSACKHKDAARVQVAGLFILLLFSAVSWAMPVEPDFVAGHWTIRIATPMGAVLTLVHLLRTKKEPPLKALLATVPRAADTVARFVGRRC